jgi:glycerol uptake facilitator-like aquaporin
VRLTNLIYFFLKGAFFGASMVYFVYLVTINNFDHGVRQIYGTEATALIFTTFPNKNIHPITCLVDQIIASSLLSLCILAITDKKLNKTSNSSYNSLYIGLLVTLLMMTFGFNCG